MIEFLWMRRYELAGQGGEIVGLASESGPTAERDSGGAYRLGRSQAGNMVAAPPLDMPMKVDRAGRRALLRRHRVDGERDVAGLPGATGASGWTTFTFAPASSMVTMLSRERGSTTRGLGGCPDFRGTPV